VLNLIISYIVYIVHSSFTLHLDNSKMEVSNVINLQKDDFPPIQCGLLFDINKYGFCLDVPYHYYQQYPAAYDNVIYYFNLLPDINYTKIRNTKIRTCQIDDLILFIYKLDLQHLSDGDIDMFWIIA